jgi:hypothetical protein
VFCGVCRRIKGNGVEVLEDVSLNPGEGRVRLGIGKVFTMNLVVNQLSGALKLRLFGRPDGFTTGALQEEVVLTVVLATVGAFELIDVISTMMSFASIVPVCPRLIPDAIYAFLASCKCCEASLEGHLVAGSKGSVGRIDRGPLGREFKILPVVVVSFVDVGREMVVVGLSVQSVHVGGEVGVTYPVPDVIRDNGI